jgi:uncharacterized protein YjaG (DUF416 family)
MMERSPSAESVQAAIEGLPPQGRLAFLLSCAERLFPNYVAFFNRHGWGDPTALREALDLGWKALSGSQIGEREIQEGLHRCEAATPDTEEFGSPLGSAALDAAVSCALVLELLLQNRPEKVLEGASLARDSVDMYVQDSEGMDADDPLREQRIIGHPLMQEELARQKRDLALLQQTDWSRNDACEDLRRQWRQPPVSNLGLSGRR